MTRSSLVATQHRLGVAGLLCESDLWDSDMVLDPVGNVALEEAGEYYAVFGQMSIEDQVCIDWNLGLLPKTCFATHTQVAKCKDVYGYWHHTHYCNT